MRRDKIIEAYARVPFARWQRVLMDHDGAMWNRTLSRDAQLAADIQARRTIRAREKLRND